MMVRKLMMINDDDDDYDDDDDESQATVGFGDPHQGCEHAGP